MMENLRRILIERPYYVDPTYTATPVEEEVMSGVDDINEFVPDLTSLESVS